MLNNYRVHGETVIAVLQKKDEEYATQMGGKEIAIILSRGERIGTSEIKVRYEKVSELIKCLNKYKKALEKMKKSIIAIREVYKEGKGKTMESLVNESDILVKYIDGLEQDVSDLSTILVKYVTETTAIIKPEQRDRVMKIDRNNILQKKNSIINTCSKIPKIHSDVTVPHFDDWILWGEDEEERELELARRARNDDKLDSIKYHIRSVEKEITSLIDKVNGVYNGVKNYEDKDQQFAWEAKKLVKDKPTPVETHDDGKSKIGEQVIHFGEGLLDSIVDLVKGLADSTVGIVKYDASFVTYLYGEISGNEIPKWADDYCYNTSVETNEKIKAVLKDPMSVVDGIKNGIQDTYEEKGVAYCCGYAVGLIGTTFAGTKGMDKLAKLGKGGKATRTLEELGYVDDAMATAGDDLAKLAEEVKTATKVADTAEDLTKVTGKVKKVTKADELSEASKALVEGGETAGKGGVVEEVVSKSGTDSWNMVEGGGTINGREYSQHAMERMAPDTPQVRAELSRRAEKSATQRGLKVGTQEYYEYCKKYVDPRNIPPSVIEDAISSTKGIPGNRPDTFIHETADVKIVINSAGKVITVIPK